MSQHTTGPWTATHDELECFKLEAGGVAIIDGCGCCNSPWLSSEADARLIAAAPDLLQALQALANMAESFPNELHKDHPDVIAARAAIAKATGEQA